jgi:putative sigma-54 modulation protein
MDIDVKAVHFSLSEDERAYLDKKIARIHGAAIIDMQFTFSKEANVYNIDANVHFQWGVNAHVSEKDFEINAAIDKLFERLSAKITKEKEKAQSKR